MAKTFGGIYLGGPLLVPKATTYKGRKVDSPWLFLLKYTSRSPIIFVTPPASRTSVGLAVPDVFFPDFSVEQTPLATGPVGVQAT